MMDGGVASGLNNVMGSIGNLASKTGAPIMWMQCMVGSGPGVDLCEWQGSSVLLQIRRVICPLMQHSRCDVLLLSGLIA
jgi:hypothetical protein